MMESITQPYAKMAKNITPKVDCAVEGVQTAALAFALFVLRGEESVRAMDMLFVSYIVRLLRSTRGAGLVRYSLILFFLISRCYLL